jgi:hypothetical protein
MDAGECVHAAPILGWAVGLAHADLRARFAAKGWAASFVGGRS